MRMCILVTNDNVEIARQRGDELIPSLNGQKLLNIPVSATGELPVTHWFCQFLVSEQMRDHLLSIKTVTEMEIADPIKFLNERNLKIIRRS